MIPLSENFPNGSTSQKSRTIGGLENKKEKMRVVYISSDDPDFLKAKEIAVKNPDGLIAISELAKGTNKNRDEIQAILETLEEKGLIVTFADEIERKSDEGPVWAVSQHSLTKGKVYEVLGISSRNFRILDDQNMPGLFHSSQFKIIDTLKPDFWIKCPNAAEEEHMNPKEWVDTKLLEKFFDRVPGSYEKFKESVKRHYPETYEVFLETEKRIKTLSAKSEKNQR